MKLWSIVFFILPLLATGYVSWRVWHIMPWGSWVSGVAVALVWLGMFVMIGNFVIGLDRVPMTLAKVLYHFGTLSCDDILLVGYWQTLSCSSSLVCDKQSNRYFVCMYLNDGRFHLCLPTL